AAATITPTAATAITAAAAAARTLFTRTRFVDGQGALVKQVAVEALDGFLAAFFSRHFNETEALGTACLAVRDQRNLADLARLGKQFTQLLFGGTVGHIA